MHTREGWIEAPPVPESFVCNIGDMLDRMTGGLYRSTPHRVRLNTSGRDRLSFPLFFDPDFDARIEPIRSAATDDHATRWDGASVHAFDGTYGDYVLGKVGKVLPELGREVQLPGTAGKPPAPISDQAHARLERLRQDPGDPWRHTCRAMVDERAVRRGRLGSTLSSDVAVSREVLEGRERFMCQRIVKLFRHRRNGLERAPSTSPRQHRSRR